MRTGGFPVKDLIVSMLGFHVIWFLVFLLIDMRGVGYRNVVVISAVESIAILLAIFSFKRLARVFVYLVGKVLKEEKDVKEKER